MLTTTDAIVLALQPHSDKAHILHAYTRTGGRVNFMVYGLGRKHAAGIYTPLSLIQLTADHDASGPLTVRSAQLAFTPRTIANDPYKRTIALFLSEVLYHTLRHPMPDEEMFDFIAEAVPLLDRDNNPGNFHLQFLISFAAKLGFAIDPEQHPELYTLPANRAQRQTQLRKMCAYFAEQVDTWTEPRSLEVLTEIFD